MGGQPGRSMTHSGEFIVKFSAFFSLFDLTLIQHPELRERTRDTNCTWEATQAQPVTPRLATMVCNSPLGTETMT